MSKENDFHSIRTSHAFRTYARRFARLAYLKQICEPGHAVLTLESELIEMARSKLHEAVLAAVPAGELGTITPVIEAWIKAVAMELTLKLEADDAIKKAVIRDIGASSPLETDRTVN